MYHDYCRHGERLATCPCPRLWALRGGRRGEFLQLDLDPGADVEAGNAYAEGRVALHAGIRAGGRAADPWLANACRLAWRAKLQLHLMLDLFNQAREKAEGEDRKSDVEGKSGSVRVDLGGRRIIKKKKTQKIT